MITDLNCYDDNKGNLFVFIQAIVFIIFNVKEMRIQYG